MKVYIGGYPNWLGPYQLAELTIKLGVSKERAHKWGEWLSETWVGDVLQWMHTKKKRTVIVKLDRYDTWAMDHTLSLIILPMLKQLKATQHGSPCVDDADVPKALQSMSALPKENSWDIDDNHFKRWDWVLDEMIWAFTQKTMDNDTSQFFDHSGVDHSTELLEQVHAIKFDKVGLDAHEDRKQRAFELFGKYYQHLWD